MEMEFIHNSWIKMDRIRIFKDGSKNLNFRLASNPQTLVWPMQEHKQEYGALLRDLIALRKSNAPDT